MPAGFPRNASDQRTPRSRSTACATATGRRRADLPQREGGWWVGSRTRAVLGAPVAALAVDLGRVDAGPEELDERLERAHLLRSTREAPTKARRGAAAHARSISNHCIQITWADRQAGGCRGWGGGWVVGCPHRIVLHENPFGVARAPAADLLVGGVDRVALAVPDGGPGDARDALVRELDAPEAACGGKCVSAEGLAVRRAELMRCSPRAGTGVSAREEVAMAGLEGFLRAAWGGAGVKGTGKQGRTAGKGGELHPLGTGDARSRRGQVSAVCGIRAAPSVALWNKPAAQGEACEISSRSLPTTTQSRCACEVATLDLMQTTGSLCTTHLEMRASKGEAFTVTPDESFRVPKESLRAGLLPDPGKSAADGAIRDTRLRTAAVRTLTCRADPLSIVALNRPDSGCPAVVCQVACCGRMILLRGHVAWRAVSAG